MYNTHAHAHAHTVSLFPLIYDYVMFQGGGSGGSIRYVTSTCELMFVFDCPQCFLSLDALPTDNSSRLLIIEQTRCVKVTTRNNIYIMPPVFVIIAGVLAQNRPTFQMG